MSKQATLRLLCVAAMGAGVVVIGLHVNWWAAGGVVLFSFGNNLEQSLNKSVAV